jgi:DNA-binding CsgD family transcriptional regulator
VARGNKARWSFAQDRRLIELAASSRSLKEIANELKRTPESVAQMAKRLGVSLKSDARLKAKGK